MNDTTEARTAVARVSGSDLAQFLPGLVRGLEIVAARRLGDADEARDAAQETIVRLLERIRGDHVSSSAEIAPIAYGILRHIIADALRARARTTQLDGDPVSTRKDPLAALVETDEIAAVRKAVACLSVSERELLHRCYVRGERIVAIAEQTGEPAERIRKRKSRALQRLTSILGIAREGGHENNDSAIEKT